MFVDIFWLIIGVIIVLGVGARAGIRQGRIEGAQIGYEQGKKEGYEAGLEESSEVK